MTSIFAYGTLMYPEVISIILGRPVASGGLCDAILGGYRRVAVPGRVYPTGIPSAAHQIQGKLIQNLTAAEVGLLDLYEESFYVRTPVFVLTDGGREEAFVYIDGRNPLPFAVQDWDQEVFEREYLQAFIRDLPGRWGTEITKHQIPNPK